MKRISVSALIVVLSVAALAWISGCQSPAQQRFAAADVRAVSAYVALAQPLCEAYCNGLAAVGQQAQAEQVRADSRALAGAVVANQAARLDDLTAEAQALSAARTALNIASTVMDAISPKKENASGTAASQPAR